MSDKKSLKRENPETSDEDSDNDYWRRSESPREEWGELDDEQWEMEIISEEVDYYGNVRHETAWSTWRRNDEHKTNTTWKDEYVDNKLVKDLWDQAQAKRRRALAKAEKSIKVRPRLDTHNTETRLRETAFEEKLQIHRSTWAKDRLRIIEEREQEKEFRLTSFGGRPLRATAERCKRQASLSARSSISSINSGMSMSPPLPLTPSTSTRTTSTATQIRGSSPSAYKDTPFQPTPEIPFCETAHGPATLKPSLSGSLYHPSQETPRSTPMSDKARGKQPATPHRAYVQVPKANHLYKRFSLDTRQILSDDWTQKSKVKHLITFVNEVDDQLVPDLPKNFKYRETGYEYHPSIDVPDGGFSIFFSGCTCTKRCKSPESCGTDGCQAESQLFSHCGKNIRAYDKAGCLLYDQIPRGTEILECNSRCTCDMSCPNRVAQRPRNFPVEIFKTKRYGWGARLPLELKPGQVIGIFTGRLMPAQEASQHSKFAFELDAHIDYSDQDRDHEVPEYVVDSYEQGNWIRFINHSCDPNLKTYPVVYDTLPNVGMYYIAFAASRFIAAYEELTFDYHPELANTDDPYSGKALNNGTVECHCGTAKCRKYIQ